MDRDHLTTRLEQTRARVASAATRYGRNPAEVRLIAVSKLQPVSAIRALYECGLRDFAENYLQEALPKLDALDDIDVTWHFTGQLQANKTRSVAERFAWVHTLDRERIAIRLSDQRPHHAPALQVCLQIRIGDEAGKGGVEPEDALALALSVNKLPRLKLRGLMCIPPPEQTFAAQKAWFDQLVVCFKEITAAGIALDTLSMGMSADLEAAIAAGATCVRIGTALFGERAPG